jgi:phosphoribosylglycinamide formyltransferase-1
MKKIILFASGAGSNVKNILTYFSGRKDIEFPLIITNNPRAGVIDVAKDFGIDILLVNKSIFYYPTFVDTIDLYKPDLLILAGFLWRVPEFMVTPYQNKIINIHPSLLPLHGGKGMYGKHVHEAVIAAGEKQSGITIHMVNDRYDEGMVLMQKALKLAAKEDAESLATKVLALEHEWYPKVIESLLGITK